MKTLQEPPPFWRDAEETVAVLGVMRLIFGAPGSVLAAFTKPVSELRRHNPLAAITVLVRKSLHRPYLERWLAAWLGGHLNVRILMLGNCCSAGRRWFTPGAGCSHR